MEISEQEVIQKLIECTRDEKITWKPMTTPEILPIDDSIITAQHIVPKLSYVQFPNTKEERFILATYQVNADLLKRDKVIEELVLYYDKEGLRRVVHPDHPSDLYALRRMIQRSLPN